MDEAVPAYLWEEAEYMEEKQEQLKLLRSLEAAAQRRTRLARWQCILTGAAAAGCAVIVILVYALMPQVRELTGQMETVLENLARITEQLAAADLEGMVRSVNDLAVASQAGVEQATEKLHAIDFETLNRAIANLADVVEPLARFFNVFQ